MLQVSRPKQVLKVRCSWVSKNLARDFSYRNLDVHSSVHVCVCSVKWLIGPSSTSSTITSFFIRLGHTRRCYRVYCAVTEVSSQRRARIWLPFFRK
jgi:hypothetical protein